MKFQQKRDVTFIKHFKKILEDSGGIGKTQPKISSQLQRTGLGTWI